MVLFLVAPGSGTFRIAFNTPGHAVPGSDIFAMAFVISNGRIERSPANFSKYSGMPADRLLDDLRALSRH